MAASDETGGPGAPEIRASDADRERTVEILSAATADGRLTLEELNERVETALAARTGSELARLTVDLPVVPGLASAVSPAVKDLVRIEQRFGNVVRDGPWVVPRRMDVRVTGGNVRLDFTQATFGHGVLRLDVTGKAGNLILVTRPGIVVDTDDLKMSFGNVKVRPPRGAYLGEPLRIEITGTFKRGNVVARPKRRTIRDLGLRRLRRAR
jgi:DUF1707 SHOCT-like domain